MTRNNPFYNSILNDLLLKSPTLLQSNTATSYDARKQGESDFLNNLIELKKSFRPQFEIRISSFLPKVTVQARRHKRKSSRRWQKKWLKRFGTKQIENNQIYQIGTMLVMSQTTFDNLNKYFLKKFKNVIDKSTESVLRKMFNGE